MFWLRCLPQNQEAYELQTYKGIGSDRLDSNYVNASHLSFPWSCCGALHTAIMTPTVWAQGNANESTLRGRYG